MSTLETYNWNTSFPEASANAMAPLHPQAVLLPIIAIPSWVLCLPSMGWQFRQGNIAAGSLILWVSLFNFFLSINSLIWPRDNLYDWWSGNIWCDINIRIQVGAMVGTTASTAMIIRKLAMVMDTRNMTVSSSSRSKRRETLLELVWCWLYPFLWMILYYVVQPARYMIYGIIGCVAPFDVSWPSVVLIVMWATITTLVAAGYAVILSYRLYSYRRDFGRLVSARNTTKSRFIRLFLICIIITLVYLPFTTYLLVVLCKMVVVPYDWNRVHDPRTFNSVIKIPSYGQVPVDKWVQLATGYWILFIFGTGSDAHNLYKQILIAVGFGKIFPSLYIKSQSGYSTPSSFTAARSWTRNLPSRAKRIFASRSGSNNQTLTLESTAMDNSVTSSAYNLDHTTNQEPILQPTDAAERHQLTEKKNSFFRRIFRRNAGQPSTVLPLFTLRTSTKSTDSDTHKSLTRTFSRGVSTHAWAADEQSSGRVSEADGVYVVREVHLACEERDISQKKQTTVADWA